MPLPRKPTASNRRQRAAAILVWFAILLPLLLGMIGLVIDAGLLMASHRHLQNSVDAAALAGAHDLLTGLSESEATATSRQFVTSLHDLSDATVTVSTPPVNGPYAGQAGYVEVIAEQESQAFFMPLLSGIHKSPRARARAVAGAEQNDVLDGIIALDPRTGPPGLSVTGNAELSSTGRVIVNSENGGIDENGNPLDEGQPGAAAFVSPFAGVRAEEVYLVGGANRVDRFQNIEPGGAFPLKTGQLPLPDPLRHLPTPTIGNGVLDVRRGSPVVTKDGIQLNNASDHSDSPNYVETNESTGDQTLVLHPGVYSSIDITGGKVRFQPGIYVLAADREQPYSLRILAGDIEAQGIMFYNTREGYDATGGFPDALDGERPGEADGEDVGRIRIDASLGFSAIDTRQHDYGDASSLISAFNGMLFYQRRRNTATMQIQGFSQDKTINGAIYAKWATLRMPAGGTINSQIVVGRVSVPGHGQLLVKHDSHDFLQSKDVFLVE